MNFVRQLVSAGPIAAFASRAISMPTTSPAVVEMAALTVANLRL
jgi:hypothetical protein